MIGAFVGITLLSFGITDAVKLPPEIQRCSVSDPDFSSCMIKSMTKAFQVFKGGSKEFGFPLMEPFQIEKLEIEPNPGKSVTLNQVYENIKMHHIMDAEVVSFKMLNNDRCQWKIETRTPMSRMEADYALTGQVLVFPINGHGKCNVTLYDIVIQHTTGCEHYTKKGKLYGRLKNYKINMSVQKCEFQFENLFPGNEQISRDLKKTINENGLEIFQEVKHGFEEVLAKVFENGANNVFSRIPLDELYLP